MSVLSEQSKQSQMPRRSRPARQAKQAQGTKHHQRSEPLVELVTVRALPHSGVVADAIRHPHQAAGVIHALTRDSPREMFVVLHLDARNRPVSAECVSVGTVIASLVHPREVFQGAILANSTAIICGHNHPSGNPEPSPEDHSIHKRLKRAGDVIGIAVLDFVIVTADGKLVSCGDPGDSTTVETFDLELSEQTLKGCQLVADLASFAGESSESTQDAGSST